MTVSFQQMVQNILMLPLYVEYKRSGTDNTIATFEDGEVLIVEDTFTYGNTTVSAGETIATVVI
ncbi:MAG: hypothetical protein CM15mV14_1030 [uncultured marine virus]|nr:MAG: hypothetical protein CM15mV14_1030 [uncultured marine virus]